MMRTDGEVGMPVQCSAFYRVTKPQLLGSWMEREEKRPGWQPAGGGSGAYKAAAAGLIWRRQLVAQGAKAAGSMKAVASVATCWEQ